MRQQHSVQSSADRFRRSVLMVIIAVSVLGTLSGWYIMAARGLLSPVLHAVQVVALVVLLALFLASWLRLLPQRVIELTCLVFAAGICVACMALRMYSPVYGAAIDLEPLYIWIPMVYVFAFMLTNHKTGLVVSLGIFGMFLCVSLPYLARDIDGRYANFTVQLHVVSAAMIATLYFFSRYQHHLRVAQARVGQLSQLSNTDALTQLSNRRGMAAAIDAELVRYAQGGNAFAMVLFDIDHFKVINDRLGHGAGDAALVALARRATEVFSGIGELGRWGGDEFVALVRNVDPVDASRMADALCAHVASESISRNRPMTISCGVTAVRRGDNIDSLLQRADAALYAAKRAGRNRVESILEADHAGGR
ncbi:MAG TPA: GGDEF domain-containing protein [Rhodanobacteraceae bacterium]|nr:GGDEF domain-containing protein [Rhodanobacteraceae bacterium]